MSQQNVQIMREGYAAFNRQDIAAVLEIYDPQIEWNEPGGGRAPAGTFHGPQNVAEQVFAHVPENFDEMRVESERFIDSGEHVVVIGHFRGTTKSGAAVEVPFAHVWRMRDGKVVQYHNHVAADEWARAWGG
jgi:uncharacterized protein